MIDNLDLRYIAILSALTAIACDVIVKLISTVKSDLPSFRYRPFSKPFTISFLISIGTSIISTIQKPNCPLRTAIVFLIPSVLSAMFLLLFNYAVVNGQAFVSFVIRQICMIFIPLILTFKKPRSYQYLVIGIASISLILAFLSHIGSIIYPFLALISMLFKLGQIYAESKLLQKYDIEPSTLLGLEGIWSTIFILFLVFPIVYLIPGSDVSSLSGGALENAYDAVIMIFTTPRIALGTAIIIFTSYLSQQTTLLLSNAKDSLPYVVSDIIGSIGAFIIFSLLVSDETLFTSADGPLQIVALILYCCATLLGNRIIKLPWFQYSEWGQLGESGEIPNEIDDLPVEE